MHKKNHRLLLGAHTSIAGGLEQAIIRGSSIGCTTIQIFTKSNRQWAVKALTNDEIQRFKETKIAYSIDPIIAHATYLINLGSPDQKSLEVSRKMLAVELERCDLLGIESLVVHPGAHLTSGETACLDRITESINRVLDLFPFATKILLEIMAGQGSSVCYSLEHLAYVIEKINKKHHVGICIDTCHAFAAGYDFREEKTYQDFWQKVDEIVGLNKVHAIHLNDSKKELGSHVDRHANIGKGMLGLLPFELLFNDERFFNIPKILETPPGTLETYAHDMKTLMKLLSAATKKKLGIEVEIK
jgi:deoxyribonuclease IV